jgi:hypothetical protein
MASKSRNDAEVASLERELAEARSNIESLMRQARRESPGAQAAAERMRLSGLQSRLRHARALALAIEKDPQYEHRLAAADAAAATAQADYERRIEPERRQAVLDATTFGEVRGYGYVDADRLNLETQLAELNARQARLYARRLRAWPMRLLEASEIRIVHKPAPAVDKVRPIGVPYVRQSVRDRAAAHERAEFDALFPGGGS